MNEMEVKPWLIRMGQGEEEAFHQVYELTRDDAYRLIYFLAPNKVDVPDIMSEVYLELYRCRKQYRQELKQEAKWSDDGAAIRLMGADVEPQQASYTTTYVNAAGQYIYVTVNEFPEDVVGITMITPESSQYEGVALNGETAQYIINEQSIFSSTQLSKTVSWIHEEEGRSVMYSVITDSAQVTKEQLVAAAESLY